MCVCVCVCMFVCVCGGVGEHAIFDKNQVHVIFATFSDSSK